MNCKQEFLMQIKRKKVICAEIVYISDYNDPGTLYILQTNYTRADYKRFVNTLDFEYDNGLGRQELFGTIWYANGTWAERGEYDGSEWWVHKKCPNIPERLVR